MIRASTRGGREKLRYLIECDIQLRLVKVFVRASIDSQAIKLNHGIQLQKKLQEIGKMLGGWIKSLK